MEKLWWLIISVLFFALFFWIPSPIFAQYSSDLSPTILVLPNCSSGTCGSVCTSGACPAGSTCTPFCNSNANPPTCAYTCSSYQSTCTGGWGAWGSCSSCIQFRVCNSNSQLGQAQWCDSGGRTPKRLVAELVETRTPSSAPAAVSPLAYVHAPSQVRSF